MKFVRVKAGFNDDESAVLIPLASVTRIDREYREERDTIVWVGDETYTCHALDGLANKLVNSIVDI